MLPRSGAAVTAVKSRTERSCSVVMHDYLGIPATALLDS